MNRVTGFVLSAAVVVGLGISASANTPHINRREHSEQQRIRQGIQSGSLTRREAGRLEAEQGRIRVDEARAKADGHVSYRERERLNHELDRASRGIYRQKHDSQHRGQ
ncbi:MAG: hypothetical protein DMF61_17720 [Blastocatellia bacterium AA13]|nr:MAG: hypothetical protein DMF61_17720 [Blastocatellia bacterium AA13]